MLISIVTGVAVGDATLCITLSLWSWPVIKIREIRCELIKYQYFSIKLISIEVHICIVVSLAKCVHDINLI